MTKNPFAEILKTFGCENYTSSFNWDKAVASSRQNAKAFGDAAKAATDGFQLIANRQAALFQKQAEEATKFFSGLASSKGSENALEQFSKAAKATTESAIANSNELFEVASKSASEAAEILNKRLSAAISECTAECTSAASDKVDKKPMKVKEGKG